MCPEAYRQAKRLCVGCKQLKPVEEMIRLTVNHENLEVFLNSHLKRKSRAQGRSAYMCAAAVCLDFCLKGTRLKYALEGRKLKNRPDKRKVNWPLESQLIHTLTLLCTENTEACHNTE